MKNPFDRPVPAEDIRFLPYMMRSREHAEYAANAINQHEKLVAAVKTYQDLCTCYRIGKQPTEKLFKMLDDAKATLLKEEKP